MDEVASIRETGAGSASWRALWAKSYPRHALWRHLLDVAAFSLELPFPLEADGWSPEQLAYVVALHDIGKVCSEFQHMGRGDTPALAAARASALEALKAVGGSDEDREWEAGGWTNERRNAFVAFAKARSAHELALRSDEVWAAGFLQTGGAKCRHELMSARFVAQRLQGLGAAERVSNAIARAIAAHHGRWEEGAWPVHETYEAGRTMLSDAVASVLCVNAMPAATPANLSAFGMRVAGHVVLADWLASNEALYHRGELVGIADLADYLAKARQEARRIVELLQLARPGSDPGDARIVDVPRGVQTAILSEHLPPGLVIVEAPMGEGKTEGAWMLAEQWKAHGYHGIYMALPTQATSESMFQRYRDDYLKRLGFDKTVRLIHGMAWLRSEDEPDGVVELPDASEDSDQASAWFRPTRRALLAEHGVGTVDQCLLAALKVKFGQLRLYGLDRRVLIVDEVHAYDAYMNAILRRLLAWCSALRIPVVLLSATLSARQRAGLLRAYGAKGDDPGPEASYPLITHGAPGGSVVTVPTPAAASRRLSFVPRPGILGDIASVARLAEAAVADGGCVCVVVNTVRNAQALYREIGVPADQKGLFHARFTAERREEIAKEVTEHFGKNTRNRPSRYVLIATQVVEQSLDVDFDYMISEIAPIDLLLQRSGRLHRHRVRANEPEVQVLTPEPGGREFGGTGRVYSPYVLLRTLEIMGTGIVVRLPEDMRSLIEQCYGEVELPSVLVSEADMRSAKAKWIADLNEMANAARQFLLKEPSERAFDPVCGTPVGDDSDDGTGWRAKTRLGASDRLCVFCPAEKAAEIAAGRMSKDAVRRLYLKAVKVPHYVDLNVAAKGYEPALRGGGALHGMTIVPIGEDGAWRGGDYVLQYDHDLGLLVGRSQ